MIDIESTISELAFELARSESNFTESEEVLLSPSTVSTFNHVSDYNEEDNENAILKVGTENITKTTEFLDINETNDSAYIIPIKIILPAPHIHAIPGNGTFEQFNYILLQTNDSAYHGHLETGKPDILYPQNGTHAASKPPTNDIEVEEFDIVNCTNGNGRGSGSGPIPEHNVPNITVNLVDSEGYQYQRTRQYQILDDSGNVAVEYEEVAAVRPKEEPIIITSTTMGSTGRQQNEEESNAASEQYDEHYSKILQWISYKL